MPLLLDAEQAMLRDSARAFLADHAGVPALRRLRAVPGDDGFDRALWLRFAGMGYAGVLVPEAHGGTGGGPVEAGVVMEAIGRHLAVSPFLHAGVVAATALRLAGDAAQQAAWLPGLASGERLVVLALDERSHHAPDRIDTRATKVAEGWRLDGAKTFVPFAQGADALAVVARVDGEAPGALGLFLVPREASGLAIEPMDMIDAQPAARVTLTRTVVRGDARCGADASFAIERALDLGRACAAAELVGLADEAFARTVAWLKERRQFERLIGEFQALQHRAAALYVDIELARSATLHALQALQAAMAAMADDSAQTTVAASVAKSRAGRSATLAVQEFVQMHGGIGMTDEFDAGFFMRRARVLQALWGDDCFHADRLARRRSY